jgi:hypothetical protein
MRKHFLNSETLKQSKILLIWPPKDWKRSWIKKYSELSHGSSYNLLCYCSYTGATELIRAVFHLDIPFICWFRAYRVLLCVFWSIHIWRSWWSRRQQVRRWHNGWCTDTVGRRSERPSDLPVSTTTLFSGVKQNFWPWDYSQRLDYQDFQIIRHQVTGILLYM